MDDRYILAELDETHLIYFLDFYSDSTMEVQLSFDDGGTFVIQDDDEVVLNIYMFDKIVKLTGKRVNYNRVEFYFGPAFYSEFPENKTKPGKYKLLADVIIKTDGLVAIANSQSKDTIELVISNEGKLWI